jgi:5-methylcytosine-specific restriction protein B
MARYSEFRTQPIYDAAKRLLERCLQGDGSMIRDESTLWTVGNLETIHRVFVDAPDEGKRTFTEKFEDQIRPAGPDVCRLAAEILAVYFFFPSNVGAARKKELVGLVLGWAGDTLPEDGAVAAALSQGIGSGGQGYNTRRPFEIAFLIEFAIFWKNLPESERLAAATDPWRFMAVVDRVDGSESKQLRHMLLHVLFPDSFERIASREHKRRVVASFSSLLEGIIPEDTDVGLLAIRKRLDELLPNMDLDFYWSPLVEVWNDSGESGEGAAPMDALRHKKQVVLYGPPGTGKTFRAKRVADRLIRSVLLTKLGPKAYFEKVNAGEIDGEIRSRIHRLQLHPAYGYEDFVRGLHIDGKGATEYRLGYLPRLVKSMQGDDPDIPRVLILDELNRTDLSRTLGECFSLLEDRDQEIELPGEDSAGRPMTLSIPRNLFVIGTMNLIDQSVEQMDFALRRRFLWVLCPFDGEALVAAAKDLWEKKKGRVAWDRVESDFVKLAKAAGSLNKEIHDSPLLGAQYEIGHTYLLDAVSFLQEDIEGRKPNTFLWTSSNKAKRPVEQTWELSLKPLILEYLSGLDSKSREAEINRLAASFLTATPGAD